MAPAPDRAVLVRLQNNVFARASHAGDFAMAERSALRRAVAALNQLSMTTQAAMGDWLVQARALVAARAALADMARQA